MVGITQGDIGRGFAEWKQPRCLARRSSREMSPRSFLGEESGCGRGSWGSWHVAVQALSFNSHSSVLFRFILDITRVWVA